MNKARLLAGLALGTIFVDVLVNFSFAIMNTAMDVFTFVIVAAAIALMSKSKKE